MREWFQVHAKGTPKIAAEVLLYGVIGRSVDSDATSPRDFVEELARAARRPGDIHVRINSVGGNAGDGMAVYNAIRSLRERVTCTIEGVAFSVASAIAVAGRETRMWDTAQFMLAKATTQVYGGEDDIKTALELLRVTEAAFSKAYTRKTGKTAEAVARLMDDVTFMTADEAKAHGFVDTVVSVPGSLQAVACHDVEAWRRYYTQAGRSMGGLPAPADAAVLRCELEALRKRLAERDAEIARLKKKKATAAPRLKVTSYRVVR